MNRWHAGLVAVMIGSPWTTAGAETPVSVDEVLQQLNRHPTVAGTDQAKSYPILFDAILEATPPPEPIGDLFSLTTIYPGMTDWSEVASWAESNLAVADAIIRCKDKTIIGLPYGRANVASRYADAGLYADIGTDGHLRNRHFAYLDAMDVMAAFVTAETYRRFENKRTDEAIELAVASLFVLRQLCDRDFLIEKRHGIRLLSESLSVLRDMFYRYLDLISADQFVDIAWRDVPFLRPDRNRLFMPEADHLLAAAMIRQVFDDRSGEPDQEQFASAFATIQTTDEPLTQFGAAAIWRLISGHHASMDASLERLQLVYDDWWRRWRVQEYDPILDIPSQFEGTNQIRYAAVVRTIEDIQSLFPMRNQLIAEVNGTALAAGICAYHSTLGKFPASQKMAYSQFVRKTSDVDSMDRDFQPFQYRLLDGTESIETPAGTIRLQRGDALLYSVGQNHQDDRAAEHTPDGFSGDIVIWPPIRAYQRAQDLID